VRCALPCAVVCLGILLPGAVHAERIWAELERPFEFERVREPFGLVEVRGWAGTGIRGAHDVVIVIDRTASTFAPSGVDLDGDGLIGKTVKVPTRYGQWISRVTDPDDSIARAQMIAARRLIERLNPESTRMGLVTFGRTERVKARLGSSREELLAVLDHLPKRPERGGTYFYGALIASIKVFELGQPSENGARHRSIIFLSDGRPNEPPPPSFAAKAAVRASQHAAKANIRIYAFALGTEVAANPDVFLEMTRANGGELLIVENPGEIVEYVPHMSLSRLEKVEIENISTGRTARAVRLFPDGTFDGFAPLTPGENLLRVTIYGEAGTRSLERTVFFERTARDSAKGRRRLELLLEQLKIRTLETQLAEQARQKRERIRKRQLTIEVER